MKEIENDICNRLMAVWSSNPLLGFAQPSISEKEGDFISFALGFRKGLDESFNQEMREGLILSCTQTPKELIKNVPYTLYFTKPEYHVDVDVERLSIKFLVK